MDQQTANIFINVFGLLVGLGILQVILKQWEKRAKAKEAKEAEKKK